MDTGGWIGEAVPCPTPQHSNRLGALEIPKEYQRPRMNYCLLFDFVSLFGNVFIIIVFAVFVYGVLAIPVDCNNVITLFGTL